MIVVIDSGVWISAFQFRGTPRKALDLAFCGATIAICAPILTEIHSILKTKFHWRLEDVDEALAEYLVGAIQVQLSGNIHGICRDPNDDMVFECAVLARASFIVSGDRDILAVKQYQGISTVSPREFLQLSESNS